MKIKSNYKQWICNNILSIIISIILCFATPLAHSYNRWCGLICIILSFGLIIYLIIAYAYIISTTWIIYSNTLIRKKGLMSRKTNYIELYRVMKYEETQTFMQRILGIKNIRITTSDTYDPYMYIIGIKAKNNYISYIRELVEECKNKRNIYEITNR